MLEASSLGSEALLAFFLWYLTLIYKKMIIPNEVFGSFLACLLGFVLMDGRDSAFDPLKFRVFKLEKLFNYHVVGR